MYVCVCGYTCNISRRKRNEKRKKKKEKKKRRKGGLCDFLIFLVFLLVREKGEGEVEKVQESKGEKKKFCGMCFFLNCFFQIYMKGKKKY